MSDIVEENVITKNTSSYQSMLLLLCEMGFPEQQVERTLTYIEIINLEQAITFLAKTESGWNHKYTSNEDIGKCFYCQEPQSEHSSKKEIHQGFFTMSKIPTLEPAKNPCPICYEELNESFSTCEAHTFCKACVLSYLNSTILDSTVELVHCPQDNCQVEFTEQKLKEILEESMFEKYKKFKTRNSLLRDPDVRFCVTPNCEGYVRGSVNNKEAVCPVCQTDFCFLCGSKAHKGTCEEVIDQAYEEWAKGKKVQLCPKCKQRTEKIEGCDHMVCSSCMHTWCQFCRGSYSETHFHLLNPLACPFLKNKDNCRNRPRNRKQWYFWVGILLLFISIPLIPIALGIYYLYSFLHRDGLVKYIDNRGIRKIVAAVVVIPLILVLIALSSMIPILLCVILVCHLHNRYCERKERNHYLNNQQ